MRKAILWTLVVGSSAMLPGCKTIGTPGGSSYYECDRGTRLRVDYLRNGAVVKVDNGRSIHLRQTPSVVGAIYEGGKGQRLQRTGDGVLWNTALRMAPERCRSIIVPR